MKDINGTKKFILIFFSIFILSTFFLGFNYDENSAGAGGFDGDFANTWRNLNTFLNFNLLNVLEKIADTDNIDRQFYMSSRTPLLYILNAYLNPFTYSQIAFRYSIFILSLIGFLIFILL